MTTGIVIVIIIIILVIVALALAAVGGYNSMVKLRNTIQESWRQVDVELNRRYELIPNLVETVRAFAGHERNTLEGVTQLRNQAMSMAQQGGPLPTEQRAQVEEQLSGAVRNLLVSVEAYPDLKSNQNFLELQRELTDTEDRIANGRRYYNANVRAYNTKIESVPTNILANMFHFETATYFEVNDPTVRQAPTVSFGEIAYRGDQPQQQSAAPSTGQLSQQPSSASDALPNPQQQWQPRQADPQPAQQQQPPQGQQWQQPQQPQQPQQGQQQWPSQPASGQQDPYPQQQQPGQQQPPQQSGGQQWPQGGQQ